MCKPQTAEEVLAEREAIVRDLICCTELDERPSMLRLKKHVQWCQIVRRLILSANFAGQLLTYDRLRMIMERKLAVAELFGAPISVISDPEFYSNPIISIADLIRRNNYRRKAQQRQLTPEECADIKELVDNDQFRNLFEEAVCAGWDVPKEAFQQTSDISIADSLQKRRVFNMNRDFGAYGKKFPAGEAK